VRGLALVARAQGSIAADILLGDSQGLSLDYYRFKRDYATGFANSFAIGPTGAGCRCRDAFAPLLEIGVRHAITPDLRLFADASGLRKARF
jgi:hypothetical protein